MKTNLQIIKQFKEHKKSADKGLSKQRKNTSRCQAFEAGDFMSYNDTVQFSTKSGQKKKAMVQFNKVKPYINAVNGFFVQNRRKPKYVANIQDEVMRQVYSKYCNALSVYNRDNANADQIETKQDRDMLINGFGAVETAMSYGEGFSSRSADGEIIMGRLDPDSVWWDDTARASNLLDARFAGVTKSFDLNEALDLFEDSKEEDFESDDSDNSGDFEYFPDGGSFDKVSYDWKDEKDNSVNVHFYQWYDIEDYWRADNPIRNLTNPEAIQQSMMELEIIASEVEDDLFDPRADILSFNSETKARLLESFGEFITPKKFKKKVYYTAVISGEKVFTKFKTISQEGFSIKFKTGDFDEKNKIWTGMVNSLMEPTLYYNKALTELMFIIGANSKGGVLYETGSIIDIAEFEENYARTDAAIEVEQGALVEGRIQPKAKPQVPTGLEQIVGISDAALADVSGIDKSFLGSSENRMETAMLQRQRVRQITSVLACYVDSINLYQKEHARMMLDLMKVWAENNRGALIRVLGERGAEDFMTVSDDKLMAEFAVYIEEAPQTPEERQDYVTMLSAMADKVRMGGDVKNANLIDSIAVKYLPIDQEDITIIAKALNPQEGEVDIAYVKQIEQQLQQMQEQVAQAQVGRVMSEIKLNNARAESTLIDINKKTAETTKILTEAEKNDVELKAAKQVDAQNINMTI